MNKMAQQLQLDDLSLNMYLKLLVNEKITTVDHLKRVIIVPSLWNSIQLPALVKASLISMTEEKDAVVFMGMTQTQLIGVGIGVGVAVAALSAYFLFRRK